MHILKPIGTSQDIVIIPRSHPASVDVELTDESTNTTAEPVMTAVSLDGFLTLSGILSVVDGRYYVIECFDGLELIYRGRCFVTSQTDLPKYSVNEGVYTEEQSFDNDFIII
jgi:hypothetical protein